MKNRWISLLVRLKLVLALMILLASGPANAQQFPEGLIGLSTSEPGVLYSINPNTGQATLFAETDVQDPSIVGLSYIEGTLYGTDLENYPDSEFPEDFTIGSIAPNGVTTFLDDQNGSSNWWGLASDDCGENILYATDSDNDNILTSLLPDGTLQTIGTGSVIGFGGMAYDDENEILYGLSGDEETMDLYRISTTTGDLTLVGPFGDQFESTIDTGLAYDEFNKILYAIYDESLFTLNVDTGEATLVGPINLDEVTVDGLAWLDPCGPPVEIEVPTLSEWGLIAMAGILGIVGLMVARRRQVSA